MKVLQFCAFVAAAAIVTGCTGGSGAPVAPVIQPGAANTTAHVSK
jgi:hypothetical protein